MGKKDKCLSDPYRHLIACVIIDAIKMVDGRNCATDKDRCEAANFLQGSKCRRWCQDYLGGVDYSLMVKEVFGKANG